MFGWVKKLNCDHDFRITNRHKTTMIFGNFATSRISRRYWEHDLVCSKCGKTIKNIKEPGGVNDD